MSLLHVVPGGNAVLLLHTHGFEHVGGEHVSRIRSVYLFGKRLFERKLKTTIYIYGWMDGLCFLLPPKRAGATPSVPSSLSLYAERIN